MMQNSVGEIEKRVLLDRRKSPSPFISRYTFIGGQRRTIRRVSDKKKHNFVDIYSPHLLLLLLLIFALNIIDSYLTLTLVSENLATEFNPIMSFYLGLGNKSFITAKFFITIIPLFTFCICKNFSISKASLASATIIYLTLIAYELTLVLKFLQPF